MTQPTSWLSLSASFSYFLRLAGWLLNWPNKSCWLLMAFSSLGIFTPAVTGCCCCYCCYCCTWSCCCCCTFNEKHCLLASWWRLIDMNMHCHCFMYALCTNWPRLHFAHCSPKLIDLEREQLNMPASVAWIHSLTCALFIAVRIHSLTCALYIVFFWYSLGKYFPKQSHWGIKRATAV